MLFFMVNMWTKVSGPNCFLKAQTSLGNLGFPTFFININIKRLYQSAYFNLNNFKVISPILKKIVWTYKKVIFAQNVSAISAGNLNVDKSKMYIHFITLYA